MENETIKLLVLTDPHHCSRTPKTAYSNAMKFASEQSVDYVLLLGDFADLNDSSYKRDFFEAINADPSFPKFLGCPGNHDLDRKKYTDRIKKIHNNLVNSKRLNKYQDRLFSDPIKHSPHLKETLQLINQSCENEFQNSFWSIHQDYELSTQFVSLNSSFFCGLSSKDEPDTVGVPEQVLAAVEDHLDSGLTTVIALHHPIERFTQTSLLPLKTKFEEFCKRHADFVIYGDEHYQLTGANDSGSNQYFTLKSMPFSATDANYNGLTLLELPKDKRSNFRLTHFRNQTTTFPVFTSLGENGFHFPTTEARSHWKHIESDPTLRISSLDQSDVLTIKNELTAIISPDIERTKKPISEINLAQLSESAAPEIIDPSRAVDKILESTTAAIVAPKDTGLTTLGHQIGHTLADGIRGHGLLPCYIDCSEISAGNINRLYRKIYHGRPLNSLSQKDIERLLSRNQLILIFDGICDETRPIISWLDGVLPSDTKRIYLVTENTSHSYKIDDDNLRSINADIAFILWPLNMAQIQSFVKDFYPNQDRAFLEGRLDKVIEAFKILNEPRYPAFVENVLHVLNRDPDFRFTSKHEAIGKSIDARLGRRSEIFGTSANTIDYEAKKLMLGFVCSEMLRNGTNQFSDEDWNAWIDSFGETRDLLLVPIELLNEFLDVGLLIRRVDGSVTFRSDYIFFYFVSIWMYEVDEFFAYVVSYDNVFRYSEAILYFIADKSKHKVDVLSHVSNHLMVVASLIRVRYLELGIDLETGLRLLQRSTFDHGAQDKAGIYIEAAEELDVKNPLEHERNTAAENAVAEVGKHLGVTTRADILADEAKFLTLLRTYAKSMRFIGNRTSEFKQTHLKTLFGHAWTMANIIAHKKDELVDNPVHIDEGIAYIGFNSTVPDDKHNTTELFYKVVNSITHNITNFAASTQLVQSLKQVDQEFNGFLPHWKRCFLLETCDPDHFSEFIDEWKTDQNIETRLHAARHVVRLAEKYCYDERKYTAFKKLNKELVKSVRSLKPALVGGKKVDESVTDDEKREYHLLSSRLASFDLAREDE